ncbi:hypothetical protein ACFYO2_46660 [Streptomyces sp. NPDC006602]|uniref:hypothetical protein n=1 Tax=Streptomyces sp. NPDC006602 TaxID=3364751 RepID=UPI0036BA127E
MYAAVGERGERVAVKAVHAGQAADDQFRARFRREVQVLRRVPGPCLVPLLEGDCRLLVTFQGPGAAFSLRLGEFEPSPAVLTGVMAD